MPNWCAECGVHRVLYVLNRCKYCRKEHGGVCDVSGNMTLNNALWSPINSLVYDPIYCAKLQKRQSVKRPRTPRSIAKMPKSEPVV